MRSHDQFNTTIYGHNDRYRGIKKGRHVVFVNPEDIAELGLADGMFVDIRGEYKDGVERMVRKFRVVSYPTARGCAAAYYPEANVLGAPEPHGRRQQHACIQGRDCEARTQRGPDPGRFDHRGIRRGQAR